jgi:hypothetical protein
MCFICELITVQTRTGFGGGFKIPEEYRKNKLQKKQKKRMLDEADEDENKKDANEVTKEEIFAHLNLGNVEGGAGAGKFG